VNEARKYTEADIALYKLYKAKVASRDFVEFRRYISEYKILENWFTRDLNARLIRLFEDYQAGKNPKLIIETPPQHGKSLAMTHLLLFLMGKNPHLKIGYGSYSEKLGIRANNYIQRQIDGGRFADVFKNVEIEGRNIRASLGYKRNDGEVQIIGTGGGFRNFTVLGGLTGETLDFCVLDDPIKDRASANSKRIRDNTWDWFNDVLMTRFNRSFGLILVTTRWHVDDVAGRLQQIDEGAEVVSYKAIAEVDEEFRKAGEALFEELKPLSFLQKMKATMNKDSWASLYQQSPVVAGGNMFKRKYLNFYQEIPKMRRILMYADTAMKTKQANDYSVFEVWGLSIDNRAYLLDMIRGKWEAPELLARARVFWKKHKCGALKIEDKASGTGLIQHLKRERIPVVPIPRAVDKVERANDVIIHFEAGQVFLPEKAHFLDDFIEELTRFPNGTHDDQVDPMLDALNDFFNARTITYEQLI
jgi:predicted phage terminase large subunit-like protein